jgi:hypothetical protein
MNRPIAMTAFAAQCDHKDERMTAVMAEADPAKNVDYTLIIVGVVYVAFAVLGFFIGEISVY